MAQHLGGEVALAAVRIDQRAALVLGDRVDREIAARQVVLERHAPVGVELEAVIARAGLSFGAGQGMLLARLRMEEDREIAADGQVPGGAELVGIGADDDPVAVAHRASDQLVAHRAAHQEAFHRFR